jgi:small subunit ribosomal protein S4
MGDPRRFRNKYERPQKLWDVDRITADKALRLGYGLRNMRELWMATAELKKYRREARRLNSVPEEERHDDVKKILTKLARLGILKEGASLDDVLSLEAKDVLERRLQTLVVRKGLARSMPQSRQLITHGFISVNGKRVSKPSYIVSLVEEATLSHSKPIDISIKSEPDAVKAEGPKTEAAPKAEEPKTETAPAQS